MRALGGAAGAARERSTLVPLQDVVTAEEVVADGVLSDEAAQEALLPTLPPGQQTVGELQATVHSPQYQQTLASLTSALQSENYNSIFANVVLLTCYTEGRPWLQAAKARPLTDQRCQRC